MNSIDVNSSEEDNGVEEIGKQMDIWKDETCMVMLSIGILDQVIDDVIEVDTSQKKIIKLQLERRYVILQRSGSAKT